MSFTGVVTEFVHGYTLYPAQNKHKTGTSYMFVEQTESLFWHLEEQCIYLKEF